MPPREPMTIEEAAIALASPDEPVVIDLTPELEYQTATPAHFRRWLERRGGDMAAGECRSTSKCPLATWLQETLRAFVVVGDRCIGVVRGEAIADLETPAWMRDFIYQVDRIRGWASADYCLRLLRNMEAGR